MNYKKFIKHRAFLYGTLSAHKAAEKILSGLEPTYRSRYGSSLYEQAYNYYKILHDKYAVKCIINYIVAIGALAGILLIPKQSLIILTILTTLYTYIVRGGYRWKC